MRRDSTTSPAFTLIELLGVLAIMGLLAGASAVLLGGSRRVADLQSAVDQIRHADGLVRAVAGKSDRPITLSIDLQTGRLRRSDSGTSTTLADLPTDVKIRRVRLAAATTDFGVVDIPFSDRGTTPSYAVCLSDSAGNRQWILCCGPTGQMLTVNPEDVDAILQQASRRADSD